MNILHYVRLHVCILALMLLVWVEGLAGGTVGVRILRGNMRTHLFHDDTFLPTQISSSASSKHQLTTISSLLEAV